MNTVLLLQVHSHWLWGLFDNLCLLQYSFEGWQMADQATLFCLSGCYCCRNCWGSHWEFLSLRMLSDNTTLWFSFQDFFHPPSAKFQISKYIYRHSGGAENLPCRQVCTGWLIADRYIPCAMPKSVWAVGQRRKDYTVKCLQHLCSTLLWDQHIHVVCILFNT